MTEDEAFKLLAVEGLGGFGWTVTVDQIADLPSIEIVYGRLTTWWNGLNQDTRDLIGEFDLVDGFWNKGWLNEWPGLYTLMYGNPFGRYRDTLDNIRMCIRNAHDRAPDYAAQHSIEKLADDPALQGEQGQ